MANDPSPWAMNFHCSHSLSEPISDHHKVTHLLVFIATECISFDCLEIFQRHFHHRAAPDVRQDVDSGSKVCHYDLLERENRVQLDVLEYRFQTQRVSKGERERLDKTYTREELADAGTCPLTRCFRIAIHTHLLNKHHRTQLSFLPTHLYLPWPILSHNIGIMTTET